MASVRQGRLNRFEESGAQAEDRPKSPLLTYALWGVVVTSFVLICRFGDHLLLDSMVVPPVWFPGGIAIGAMFAQRTGSARLKSAVLFALLLGVCTQFAFDDLGFCLVATVSSLVAFVLAAMYITRMAPAPGALETFRGVATILLPAVLIESIGLSCLVLIADYEGWLHKSLHTYILDNWVQGTLASEIGSVLAAPIVSKLLTPARWSRTSHASLQRLSLQITIFSLVYFLMRVPVRDPGLALGMLCLPFSIVLFSIYWFDVAGAALVMSGFVVGAAHHAVHGAGPLALLILSGDYGILGFQLLSVVTSGASLLMAGAIADRRRLLEMSLQNESRYRGIFTQSHEAIVVFDATTEQIVDANDRALRLYGYSREEFIGTPFSIVNMNKEESASRLASANRSGCHAELRVSQRRKNGDIIRVDIGATVIDLDGRRVVVSMNRDVTEQVAAEETLRESEQRYRDFAENVPGLSYCYMIESDGTRSVAYVSPRISEWRKVHPFLVIGAPFEIYPRPYLHPNDRERVEQLVAERRVASASIRCEYRVLAGDGAYRWIHHINIPFQRPDGVMWNCLAIDVTEYRAALEGWYESESRLQAILNNTPNVAVAEFDVDGRVHYWNPAAERMFGWSAQDAVGQTLNQLIFTSEQYVEYLARLRAIIATGETPHSHECVFHRRDGRIGIALSTLFRLDDSVTGAQRFVCMGVDVTEKLNAERIQRELDARMQQAQKLDSLGLLAGGIAHDFNNVLMAIMGNAAVAAKMLASDSPVHGYLSLIQQAAQDGAALTRQMLVYAGRVDRAVEEVDAAALLRETAKLMEAPIGSRAAIQVSCDPALPMIRADATQFRQIIVNLITNAAEAMGEKFGKITLVAALERLDADFLRACAAGVNAAPGLFVAIKITDNGCGMSQSTINRMLEPFFSTKIEGRGLGMSSIVGILRAHRGAMHVQSTEGLGTTIAVYFPAEAAAGARDTRVCRPEVELKSSETGSLSKTRKILIAEDDVLVRDIVCVTLSDAGFECITAENGRDALKIVDERRIHIDVALLDVVMPGMRGDALFAELRKRLPDLPVVLMSGNTMRDGVEHLLSDTCRLIKKPFQLADLLEAVDEVMSAHQS